MHSTEAKARAHCPFESAQRTDRTTGRLAALGIFALVAVFVLLSAFVPARASAADLDSTPQEKALMAIEALFPDLDTTILTADKATFTFRATFEGLGEITDPDLQEMVMYAALFKGTGLEISATADALAKQLSLWGRVTLGQEPYLSLQAFIDENDTLITLPELYERVIGLRNATLGQDVLTSPFAEGYEFTDEERAQLEDLKIDPFAAYTGGESFDMSLYITDESGEKITRQLYRFLEGIETELAGPAEHLIGGQTAETTDYKVTVRVDALHALVYYTYEVLLADPAFTNFITLQLQAMDGYATFSEEDYAEVASEVLEMIDEAFATIDDTKFEITAYTQGFDILGLDMPLRLSDGSAYHFTMLFTDLSGGDGGYFQLKVESNQEDGYLTLEYHGNADENGKFTGTADLRTPEDNMQLYYTWDPAKAEDNFTFGITSDDAALYGETLPLFEIGGTIELSSERYMLRVERIASSLLGAEIFVDFSYILEAGGDIIKPSAANEVYYPLEDTAEGLQSFLETITTNLDALLGGILGTSFTSAAPAGVTGMAS